MGRVNDKVASPVSMVTLSKFNSLHWLYGLRSFSSNFRGIEKGGSFFKRFVFVIQWVHNHCTEQ